MQQALGEMIIKAEYKHITFKNNSIIIIGKGNTIKKKKKYILVMTQKFC